MFAVLDPGAAIVPSATATADQVRALYRRFFLTDADADDVSDSLTLLATLAPSGANAAWRGLCAAYLGSMRFVTY